MSLGPARSQVDLSHQGQDIPEVTGLEAWVLHHLQQQVRRGLGQGLGSFQEDLIVVHMARTGIEERWQRGRHENCSIRGKVDTAMFFNLIDKGQMVRNHQRYCRSQEATQHLLRGTNWQE